MINEEVSKFIEFLKYSDRIKDRKERLETIDKISNSGNIDAVPFLCELLLNEYWDLQCKIAIALGKLGDKRAIESLRKALKVRQWHVREAAALALGDLNAKEALEDLKKQINDRSYGAREAAKQALAIIDKENTYF